ncbi:hypothetical protein ALC53_10059 [Atta colombica]|uniref:Uncharacterized protein n=1 Tax=Atta colombica TaxID=520822 RepID=A0A151I0V1_9HYME|nr:hypothetical protein ALC53_10059 [Atta colombica]
MYQKCTRRGGGKRSQHLHTTRAALLFYRVKSFSPAVSFS